jgi:hypothetical protein
VYSLILGLIFPDTRCPQNCSKPLFLGLSQLVVRIFPLFFRIFPVFTRLFPETSRHVTACTTMHFLQTGLFPGSWNSREISDACQRRSREAASPGSLMPAWREQYLGFVSGTFKVFLGMCRRGTAETSSTGIGDGFDLRLSDQVPGAARTKGAAGQSGGSNRCREAGRRRQQPR